MMDGVRGYVTHVALILVRSPGVLAGQVGPGGAGVCRGRQHHHSRAEMDDYHRTTYAAAAISGQVHPPRTGTPELVAGA